MTENFDLVGPFNGPCAICGAPDQRHRIYDAISSRLRAGEDVEDLMADYPGADVEAIEHNDSDSTNEPCTICRDGEEGICTMHELKITRGAIRRGQDNNPK